jgi:hypothetical protein
MAGKGRKADLGGWPSGGVMYAGDGRRYIGPTLDAYVGVRQSRPLRAFLPRLTRVLLLPVLSSAYVAYSGQQSVSRHRNDAAKHPTNRHSCPLSPHLPPPLSSLSLSLLYSLSLSLPTPALSPCPPHPPFHPPSTRARLRIFALDTRLTRVVLPVWRPAGHHVRAAGQQGPPRPVHPL